MSAGNTDLISIDVVLKARVDSSETEEDLAGDLLGSEDSAAGKKREETLEKLEDVVSGLDEQGLRNLKAIATNPNGLVKNELLGLLGRAGVHGAIAVAIITLVIESPEIISTVIQALGQKGGPLNQDYTRNLAEENQLGFDRDLQYRKAVGFEIVITSEDRDFILSDPGFVTNSLVDIETTRSIRIDSNEVQYGYANGL